MVREACLEAFSSASHGSSPIPAISISLTALFRFGTLIINNNSKEERRSGMDEYD
jgi:hypothetical protein